MSNKISIAALTLSLLFILSTTTCTPGDGQKQPNIEGGIVTGQSDNETKSDQSLTISQPDSSAGASSNSTINIPPDIMAKLPASVADRIRQNGFDSLPSDMKDRIRQLIAGAPVQQTPSSPTTDTGNLQPTGENYKNLVPLTDLKNGSYKGYEGGLYVGGSNEPATNYLKIGMDAAAQIRPLGSDGKPDNKGKIVLLTVGFSNTTMDSQAFIKTSNADPQRNPNVYLVDGAVGGRDAIELSNPGITRYWDELKGRLDQVKVTPAQVQVIWLKEVVAGDTLPFPQDAERFRDALLNIVKTLKSKFTNLRIIYVSSRTYGGYALRNGSQEPWAYEGGFAYNWMIEEWAKGSTPGNPWVAWGPYLWANGATPRNDGLAWNLSDFRSDDQMHPGASGTAKVASMLSDFFKTNPTAKSWYLK